MLYVAHVRLVFISSTILGLIHADQKSDERDLIKRLGKKVLRQSEYRHASWHASQLPAFGQFAHIYTNS